MLQSERYDSKSLLTSNLESFGNSLNEFGIDAVYDRDCNRSDTDQEYPKNRRRKSMLPTSPTTTQTRKLPVSSKGSPSDTGSLKTRPEKVNGINSDKVSQRIVTFSIENTHTKECSEKNDSITGRTLTGQDGQSNSNSNKVVSMTEKEMTNLKDLVMLHLDLVRQQQEIIMEKDKLISELRAETAALKTRLERMDRRLVVAKSTPKNQNKPKPSSPNRPVSEGTTPTLSTSHPTQPSENKKLLKTETNTLTTKNSEWKPNLKQRKELKRPAKPCKPAEIDDGLLRVKQPYYTKQVHEFREMTEQTIPNKESLHVIEVPSFRVVSYTNCQSKDDTEDLDDQTFNKRHSRHETEEKRRKRWDLQRLREVQMIEKLKQNQSTSRASLQKPDTLLDNIFPIAEFAQEIEVKDSLPVNVFGHTVSQLPTQEFSLPWYKPKIKSHKAKRIKQSRR